MAPRGGVAAGGARTNLSARLAMADRFAQAKLAALIDNLDAATEPDRPAFGGGRITRPQFRALLTEDSTFQQQVLASLPFATDAEKRSLRAELERLLPVQAPATTTQIPRLPIDSVNEPPAAPGTGAPAAPFGQE